MNPYDERRLRDEVIYLHSLWRQGPSRNPDPPPNQPNDTNKSSRSPLKPTTASPLKKRKRKRKRSSKKHNNMDNTSDGDPGRDSDYKWPVNPTPDPPPPTTGWGEMKKKTQSKAGPLSAHEKAKVMAMQAEQKGIEACHEFFSEKIGDESDEEEDRNLNEEFGEEDYLTEDDGDVDSEEFKFLLELFVKDDKLRSFYEKNHENGEFCCLVCRGIGEKLNKRYKDCLGLVQHTISISKTKRKRAHKALGRVVCKVLGWDFDRLPVIVLKGEPLGTSLGNSGFTKGEGANANAEDNKEDMTVAQVNEGSTTGNDSEIVEKVVLDGNRNDGELMIGEDEWAKANAEDNNEDMTFSQVNKGSTSGNDGEIVEKAVLDGNTSDCNPDCDLDRKWPIKPTPSPPLLTTGWGEMKMKTESKSGPLSAQEKAKVMAMQTEQKGLEACHEFFYNRDESDEEEDHIRDEEFDEEDYLTEDDGDLDSEEFKFFLELFVKDDKLRSFYEKNHENGEFCCLVCRGIGEKLNKRYKNCLSLVQHTISISKTKRKRAHRAFGQVVCKVLGWDFDSLPVLVLKGEPLGTSLVNSDLTKDEGAKANAEDNKDDITVAQANEASTSGNDGEIVEKVVLDGNRNYGEVMIGEDEWANANAEDNEEDMTVAQVDEGSTSGNDGEIVEKVVLNGNWNDGGLMIGEAGVEANANDDKDGSK
ncbi:uncharacterized protein LOC123227630 [Mangifera indica]|uniref:uncharacterized protein LOC123227630 n=1 Tax=Mangifera indica TaxID=29780 RepID=UPI001CFB408C|nr:uncharacterized protein LOC123227630 [Mangifera indica]